MKFRRVFHFKFSVLFIATSIWFLPTSFSTQAQAASSENNTLLKAVFKDDISKVEILPDKGANPDIQDNGGKIEGIRKIFLEILLKKEAQRIVEDEKQTEVQGTDSRISDFKFRDYLQKVDHKIRWRWAPPPITPEEDSLVVRFDIKKDGSIDKKSVVVEESSGNLFFEQAAIRAVYAAHPLPPLPNAYTNDILTVYMNFIVHKEMEKTISAGLRDSLLLIATDDGKTKIEKKREMIEAMLTSNIDTGSLLHSYDNLLKDLTRRLDSPIRVKLFSHAFYHAKDELSYKCRKKESNIDPYELLFPIANENIPITQMKHEMRFFLRFYGKMCEKGVNADWADRIIKYLKNKQCQTEWSNRKNTQISGAFGMALGCKFDPNFAVYKSSLTDGIPIYRFIPIKPFRSFSRYYVMITPESHQIYKIWAIGNIESIGKGSKERDLIFTLLEKKYGKQEKDRLFEAFSGSRTITRKSKRIEVDVNGLIGDSKIDMTYIDVNLESLAEEERLLIESSKVDDSGF